VVDRSKDVRVILVGKVPGRDLRQTRLPFTGLTGCFGEMGYYMFRSSRRLRLG
jgi:uracil-DNA glycosylase